MASVNVVGVHMVALLWRFTRSKCDVQLSFKCLSFTKVIVQCDVHSLIMSPFSVHVFSVPSLAIHGEGVGESDIRRPLDPARPWALLLGTPRCSDQAVTTAAS